MAEQSATRQIVVFSLGEEEYALPISDVQEIIRYSEPRSVASDVAWIPGVISLRGRILPVCDLAARFGLTSGSGTERKIVIVATGSVSAGMIVDDVDEVVTIGEDQVEDLTTASSEAIEGIAKLGDRLVVLLTTDAIFRGPDLAAAA
jgi:purine-binding chemotaxis protein CheW